MKILESAENYLETILILKKQLGEVRSVDIANYLNFSKPSISKAMKILRESGHIVVNESNYISLTKKGMDIASKVYDKHYYLTKFFISLGVDENIAKEDACKIEHVISEDSYIKIKKYVSELID